MPTWKRFWLPAAVMVHEQRHCRLSPEPEPPPRTDLPPLDTYLPLPQQLADEGINQPVLELLL